MAFLGALGKAAGAVGKGLEKKWEFDKKRGAKGGRVDSPNAAGDPTALAGDIPGQEDPGAGRRKRASNKRS